MDNLIKQQEETDKKKINWRQGWQGWQWNQHNKGC